MPMLSWKQSLKSGSIAKQLDALTEEQLQANSSLLKSVGRVVELCSRQPTMSRKHLKILETFWRFRNLSANMMIL